MLFYRIGLIACVLLTVAACSSSKKNAKNKDGVYVNLDTLEITALRDNPYRASAPKDFDLLHTKLEVSFKYEKQYLYGKATLTLKPHFYPQHTLVLDAKQFDIQEISLIRNGDMKVPLDFKYDSLQLTIELDKEYTRDEQIEIFIYYTAKPNERKSGGSAAITEDKGLYFINPDGKDSTKPIQIWTQGETEASSCWFPTIDKPNQKTTDEIYITHDKKYVSLSNGTMVYSKDNGDGTVTDYWKMNLPHAPYLFMMAIGEFTITKTKWRDIPVNYYVEPKYAQYTQQIFGNTPEMMEFFSQKLGFDYPWPKYSQIIVRDYVSGAMENTSATLHGEFLNRNTRELLDETYEDVISHELFHQWFGDLVTTESWSNIPLNESFATYGEYLWNEYKYGKEYADYKLYDNYGKYMEESAEGKNVDLVRFYYGDKEEMFDRHSYEKGGLLLHYLRNTIGDDAFFKALELYLKTNQFKPVEVHQLRLAFEEVTGKDMNWFFNQWFLNSGHPQLNINYSYDADSVYVDIEQKHNTEKALIYTLPMRIDVYYGKVINSYNIELKKKKQRFAFKSYGSPTLIDADGARVVLCEKEENKSIENYIFQYRNAPLFIQRYEAISALAEKQDEDKEAKAVVAHAMNDKFFILRMHAINSYVLPKNGTDSVVYTLEKLAKADAKSLVREAAISKLSSSAKTDSFKTVYENGVNDSSYLVVAASLKGLQKTDGKKALELAKTFESETNNDVAAAVADVYSKEGDADYAKYFKTQLHTKTGFTKYVLFFYYANFLTRMDKAVVLDGIKDIEAEGRASEDSHFLIGAAKGSLKRISKIFGEKKTRTKTDMAKEDGKTAKLEMEEKIGQYDEIIAAANDALARLDKK